MRYLIVQSHETKGPYTLEQLRSMWHSGLVTGETLFCEEGTENWATLETLASMLEPASAPPPIPDQIAPPVPLSRSLPAQNNNLRTNRIFKALFLTIVVVFVGLPLLAGFIGVLVGRPAPSSRSVGAQRPESLPAQAEFSLRQKQFSKAAGLLNRIVSDYPASQERATVGRICAILRDKEPGKDGSVTADEARRLRLLMDSVETIKRGYQTATPEKRRDLELVFGAETFRQDDNGLEAVSSAGKNLKDS